LNERKTRERTKEKRKGKRRKKVRKIRHVIIINENGTQIERGVKER